MTVVRSCGSSREGRSRPRYSDVETNEDFPIRLITRTATYLPSGNFAVRISPALNMGFSKNSREIRRFRDAHETLLRYFIPLRTTVTFCTAIQSPFGSPLSHKRIRYRRVSAVPTTNSGVSSRYGVQCRSPENSTRRHRHDLLIFTKRYTPPESIDLLCEFYYS